MVGKQGLEPRLPAPKAGALTLTPHPGRDPRSRTAFLLNPNQADYRLPRSREVLRHPDAARWRWRESNPLRRRLQGVSATSAVIPVPAGVAGLPDMMLTLLTSQQASTFTLGWCSAGIAGVEPAFRSGWGRVAYPLADP